MPEITEILKDWSKGEHEALDRLFPLIYDELHKEIKRKLGHSSLEWTLQPTALLHEVYIRMRKLPDHYQFPNRLKFFSLSSQIIRHILVDHARLKLAQKRGSGDQGIPIDTLFNLAHRTDLDLPTILTLDKALNELDRLSPRQRKIIELRFFEGFEIKDCAEYLNCSVATINRDLQIAKKWICLRMKQTS